MSQLDKLLDAEYEDVVVFKDFDYDSALIGVSNTNQAIYDYNLMVDYLMNEQEMTLEDAVEWIDYNTLGSVPSNDGVSPIIVFPLD